MMMTNMTSIPMCRRGTMAFMMEFNTICKPGEAHTPHKDDTHTHRLKTNSGKHTWDSRNEPQGPQHPEGPQSFDVQASGLPCRVVGLSWLVVRHAFRYHAEQPARTHTWPASATEDRLRWVGEGRPKTYPTMTMMKSSRFQPLRM